MRDVAASARFYGWLLNTWPKEWTHRYATFIRQDLEQNVVLVVAVAIGLFGLNSIAALVTVVGVLVEVPVMLSLVWFANRTRHWFPAEETTIRAARSTKTT